MRAATWATNRDIGAARISWDRARDIADRLAEETDYSLQLRIARAPCCAESVARTRRRRCDLLR